MMQLLRLALALMADPAATTDDAWDCYIDNRGTAVCERVVWPCRWRADPAECTVRASWAVVLPDGSVCDLNDPLACLPAESDGPR